MRLKHLFILSLLSVSALYSRAQSLSDNTLAAKDTIWFEDGAWYLGEIADSMFNGYGIMVYPDSTVYQGEWKNGLWDGKGELHFSDGDSYSGEFKEHEFCGYGTYIYADGGVYEGYWEYGMFNGAGTMTYSDGSIYTGEWKNDKKEGMGVFYDAITHNLMKGYFKNDNYYSSIEQKNNAPEYSNRGKPSTTGKTDDGKFHYDRSNNNNICISYGLGSILSIHTDFHTSDWLFCGFQIGVNTVSHTIGEVSVTTDDETGEKVTLIGWDWYKDEILTEHTYPIFKLSGECGVSWRKFSIGTAFGIGLNNTIRNCRSKEGNGSYYEPGTLYYRNKITGVTFAYDVFTQYVINMPVVFTDYISLRAGFSNIDLFHIGIGVLF